MDLDRRTLGARYLDLAMRHTWLTLALSRQGVAPDAVVYLVEHVLQPPLNSLGEPVPAPPVDLGQCGTERVLTPYRRVAVAVLADLGVPGWLRTMRGPNPEDELRNASRLLFAARVCGVTEPGTAHPTRGARGARRVGRRLLAAMGAWPWCCLADGALPPNWWSRPEVAAPFVDWLRAQERDALASHQRRRAAAWAVGASTD